MNTIKWTVMLAGLAATAASTGCCCNRCGSGWSAPAWMGGAPAATPAYPPAPVTYPGPATYTVPPGGVPAASMPGPTAPTNVQYPTSQIPTQNTNYK